MESFDVLKGQKDAIEAKQEQAIVINRACPTNCPGNIPSIPTEKVKETELLTIDSPEWKSYRISHTAGVGSDFEIYQAGCKAELSHLKQLGWVQQIGEIKQIPHGAASPEAYWADGVGVSVERNVEMFKAFKNAGYVQVAKCDRPEGNKC
jgi:hypothetical protein